jgi:uncharacterized membrane protein
MFGIFKIFKVLKWKKKLQYFFFTTIVLGTARYFWPKEVAQAEAAFWYLKMVIIAATILIGGALVAWLIKKFWL